MFKVKNRFLYWATSKTWTQRPWIRTLNSDPEKPGPRKNLTLKNLDPKKPGPKKTCEIVERRKNIRRPNSIILLTLEICHEETFKQAFREICY